MPRSESQHSDKGSAKKERKEKKETKDRKERRDRSQGKEKKEKKAKDGREGKERKERKEEKEGKDHRKKSRSSSRGKGKEKKAAHGDDAGGRSGGDRTPLRAQPPKAEMSEEPHVGHAKPQQQQDIPTITLGGTGFNDGTQLLGRDESDSTVLYGEGGEVDRHGDFPAEDEDDTVVHDTVPQDPAPQTDAEESAASPRGPVAAAAETDDPTERTSVTIRFMDNLLPDPMVVNPVVRFWIVDGYTGRDVTFCQDRREPSAYGGFYCNPCDLREAKGYTARWEESVHLKLSVSKLLDVCPDAMLLFEVIDCSRVNVQRQLFYRRNYGPGYGRVFYPICWGFLKLQGVDGRRDNTSGKHRVQLYRTPLRRSLLKGVMLKLWPASVYPSSAVASVPGYVQPNPAVPPLFLQYMSSVNRLDKYPATLHMLVTSEAAVQRTQRAVPRDLEQMLLECRRALSPLQQALQHRASLLSQDDDGKATADEPIELPECTRRRGEKCVVPDVLQASLSGGRKGCLALAFSPCGRYLALAACDEQSVEIRVHDTKYGPTPHHEACRAARLACPQIAGFDGHRDTVYALLWSPGGRYLISCSADNTAKQWPFEKCCHFEWQNYPTVSVLEEGVKDGTIVGTSGAEFTFVHPCHVYTAACHPLGEMLLTGGFDDTIRGWSMMSGRLIMTCKAAPKSWVSHLALTSDGSMLYAADGNSELKLWTLSGLTRAAKSPKLDHWATVTDFRGKGITCLRVQTAAKQLFVWTRVDSSVTCINTSTFSRFSQVRKFRGPRFESCALKGCLSPCGSILASGSSAGNVYFWSTATAEYVDHDHTGLDFEHSGPVYATAWSPTDHRMAFSSYSARLNLVTVWYSPTADDDENDDGAVKVTNVASSRALETLSSSRGLGMTSPLPAASPMESSLHNESDNWMEQIIMNWTDRVTKRAQRLVTAGSAVEVNHQGTWRQGNVTGWSADGMCTVEFADAQGGAESVLPVNMRRLRASSNSGVLASQHRKSITEDLLRKSHPAHPLQFNLPDWEMHDDAGDGATPRGASTSGDEAFEPAVPQGQGTPREQGGGHRSRSKTRREKADSTAKPGKAWGDAKKGKGKSRSHSRSKSRSKAKKSDKSES